MAAAGAAWDFWKTISASSKTVDDEANKGFRLALVGAAKDRARLKETLLTESANLEEREEAESFLSEFEETPETDAARAFSFVLYAPAEEGDPIGVRGANSVPLTGTFPTLAKAMVEQQPGIAVAMARRFPLFRDAAGNRVIRDVSRINAGVSLISALPGILPITGIFLPVSSVGDVILITKNQITMVLRLAAVYGHKPAYTRQIKELMATIGAALGWRTLARQVAGAVPAGFGMALKATIAYSGTVAAGKAAVLYYRNGRKPTTEEIQQAYDESKGEAEREVDALRNDKRTEAEAH